MVKCYLNLSIFTVFLKIQTLFLKLEYQKLQTMQLKIFRENKLGNKMKILIKMNHRNPKACHFFNTRFEHFYYP